MRRGSMCAFISTQHDNWMIYSKLNTDSQALAVQADNTHARSPLYSGSRPSSSIATVPSSPPTALPLQTGALPLFTFFLIDTDDQLSEPTSAKSRAVPLMALPPKKPYLLGSTRFPPK